MSKTAILFIGHGSRLPYNKQIVTEIAQKYQTKHPDQLVDIGFMELVHPNIPTAFNKLKDQGADKIIVNPIFLANGMHTRVDIPTILKIDTPERQKHKPHTHNHDHQHEDEHHHHHHAKSEPVDFDGEIIYLPPLGADPKIANIITEKINKEHPDDNTGILLIGHGSNLPHNNKVVEEIANYYKKQNPNKNIEVGFMQLSTPTIPEATEKLIKKDVNKIIANPVFLAEGIHTKIDIPSTLGLPITPVDNYDETQKHYDTINFNGEIILTTPLGADDTIVDIIDKRISEHL